MPRSVRIFCFPSILIPVFPEWRVVPIPAQKPIPSLHKNLSGLGIGLPMKIATDDF
jgi:hypothetical protein